MTTTNRAGFLDRFGRDDRGVAATEFALILPIAFSLYVALAQVGNILEVDRKATAVAATVADLVSQTNTINDDGIEDVFAASAAILRPFDTTTVKIVVSSVVNTGGNVQVVWSDGRNEPPRAPGSSVTLPNGLAADGSSVIMAEVIYTYTDPVSKFLTGPSTFRDTFYMRPRRSMAVARVP